MTVLNENAISNHAGNNSATTFDFDFLINAEDELTVLRTADDGTQTTLTLNTDYSINETGNESGSYITFPLESSSYGLLQSDETISIYPNLSFTQETAYKNSSVLSLENIENSFDYQCRLAQQLKVETDRAVKVPYGSDITADELLEAYQDAAAEITSGFASLDAVDAKVDNQSIANVKDDGAKGNGANDTSYFNTTIARSATIYIPDALTTFSISNVQLTDKELRGNGKASIIKAYGANDYALCFGRPVPDWDYKRISDITIQANTGGNCARFYNGGTNDTYAGRIYFDNVYFKDGRLVKEYGNIGNMYTACLWQGASEYGFHSVASLSPSMHVGCDLFYGGHFQDKTLAAIYIDGLLADGSGQTVLNGTVIEQNAGFGVFAKNYQANVTAVPLTLRDVWLEANATATTVVIDGVTYTPHDIRFEDVKIASIEGSYLKDIELVNSVVIAKNCRSDAASGSLTLNVDADSALIMENLYANQAFKSKDVLVRSLAYAHHIGGTNVNYGNSFLMPSRCNKHNNLDNLIQSESFDKQDVYAFTGTSIINTVRVNDGVIFDTCAEITVPTAKTELYTACVVPANKYIVWSLDVKRMTTAEAVLSLSYTTGLTGAILTEKDRWLTYVGLSNKSTVPYSNRISIANTSGSDATYRLSAYQVMYFDTLTQALKYIEDRAYCYDTFGEHKAAAAPTVGTFKAGHRVLNSAPASGQPDKWVNTVNGTFGTLAGVTGTIKTGTSALTINALDILKKWQKITIAGVTGVKRVIQMPVAIASTTVDVSSASGQKVLSITDTTSFAVNDLIKIDKGNANEETNYISSIQAGISLTLMNNLTNTHAIGITVENAVLLDSVSDATVTTAAVAYSTPVFKGSGAIAA